ncbi:50S ribosomal protein L4 [Candidatus Phytoplasma melaleucae]|uniref:Large ribosomal subunit protein uL4 n=1 Tax=Candidatus Phytoplasma melaleucae TaxID=2982630 RepID=A0ABT9DET7_9MOLU|nr:50S ribosomal protein L4 ['Melaleuca sp.' phytoplasma]MDO8168126.1 50S ribosomal protein L4 ['Melaleuca sp.' phytoplasma]MDV3205246.1 50S ribosomal protein L4 [Weeping tea tree witches'-broom phytoplasma]
MLKYKMLNMSGQLCQEIFLPKEVFGIKPNQQVLYDVINKQKAAQRHGNHKTKSRSEVSGGGRKPWPQKGTGKSRQGTIRSPIWTGGGHTFALKKRDYDFKVNYKVRKLALNSAFSFHTKRKSLIILDLLYLQTSKTKEIKNILKQLHVADKILIIVRELNDNLVRATNNLPQVILESCSHVSVYEILNAKYLLMTQDAINYFEKVQQND